MLCENMGLIRPVHQHTVVSLKGEQHFHRYCHLNRVSANVKRQSHLFHTAALLSYLTPLWQIRLSGNKYVSPFKAVGAELLLSVTPGTQRVSITFKWAAFTPLSH